MSRYTDNYKEIDWSDVPAWRPKRAVTQQAGVYFLPDIAPFKSPIDGSTITSRSVLREHEKVHGVKQVGSDFKLKDYDAANIRREGLNERVLDKAFRTAIERAGITGD